jgi:hypothetical protein
MNICTDVLDLSSIMYLYVQMCGIICGYSYFKKLIIMIMPMQEYIYIDIHGNSIKKLRMLEW